MFDLDEIMKRAQAASDAASQQLKESMEKSRKISERMQGDAEKAEEAGDDKEANNKEANDKEANNKEVSDKGAGGKEANDKMAETRAAEQFAAGQQRQVEILGQMFSPEIMAQMASSEALLQQMVDEKAAETAALGVEGLMGQLFGEDMGVIAAALETLEMEEGGDEDEEENRELDLALEEELYGVMEEKLRQIETLPEPEPVPFIKGDSRWEQFGILLSGIISNLNDHLLDRMDVEEHIPVMEQQIVSLVRRSWGINGRRELLDTIRYLTQEGYTLRYSLYCEAASSEELLDGTDDEEEQELICRGWRFAQHYKSRFAPGFLTGWDVGRAAMLARWGCYLGWLTEGEATGILLDLSQRAAEELHSWREFAQSYLFGGLMWKLLCGDGTAESYLGFLADAATDLLTGNEEDNEGQWRTCPWPEARRIGFHV